MESKILYTALVAAVALQRLVELGVSRRNQRRLEARGAREFGRGHYPWMVALHVAFLVACVVEPWWFARPWLPWLGWPMVGLLAAAQVVRVWTIRSLGGRWTVRVIVEPGAACSRRGPFRWLAHPNYLVVVVEMAALPLVHTAWLTAMVFSVLNLGMLRLRLRSEEAALARLTDWSEVFGDGRA